MMRRLGRGVAAALFAVVFACAAVVLSAGGVEAAVPVTVPNPPTGLTTAPTGSTGVEFWWTPGSNGHAPVDHFTINYYIAGVYQGVWTTVPQYPRMVTLTGFTTGVSYQFTMSAHNSVGDSAQSKMSVAVRVGAPTAPGCCSSAIRVAAGAIKLKFTKPYNDGATITKFTAVCSSSNGGVLKSKTGKVTLITVTGLTPDRHYTCKVSATNSRGTGPWSRPTNQVTS